MIKGKLYYEFDGTTLKAGYPKRLKDIGVYETDLDAGIWWKRSGRSYLFKGDDYWSLVKGRAERNFPQSINVWPDIPRDLDAAFMGTGKSGENETYFVKGNKYWKLHSSKFRVVEALESFREDFLGCDTIVTAARTGTHSSISTGVVVAIIIVSLILLLAAGAFIYKQKFSAHKYSQQAPTPRGPPPPYSRGYVSHFENGENPDERYLWVKSINHGWNNLKYSLQHKV